MQSPDSISQGPKGILTLGPCHFEGIFDCPCPAGIAYELVKDFKLGLLCSRCGHALSLHHDHKGKLPPIFLDSQPRLKIEQEPMINSFQAFNAPQEPVPTFDASLIGQSSVPANQQPGEIPLINTPALPPEPPVLVCERQQTVSEISLILDTCRSVFIWGMPGSGKTTLAYSLFEHFSRTPDNNNNNDNNKVIIIPDWPDEDPTQKKKPEEVLLEKARLKFPDITAKDILTQDFIFIVDGAQETLRKQKSGWNTLIKNSVSTEPKKGPRFCLFSDQGMFAESQNVFATMSEISHLKTHGNGNGCASLFFTVSEFEELIEQNRVLHGLVMSKEASDHIFWLTGGHPYVTQLILEYVNTYYDKSIPSISRADIQAILHDDTRLFNYIGNHMYPGQFARDNVIATRVFKRLLSAPEGKIFWSAQYSTIGKCFVNGLVCHEIDENDTDVFKFPSPLHARWAQWYHKIEPGVYAGEFTP